jgi:hypothetical protein
MHALQGETVEVKDDLPIFGLGACSQAPDAARLELDGKSLIEVQVERAVVIIWGE